MILTLSIENTQLYGAIFCANKPQLHFRKRMQQGISADELGIFLRTVLRENGFHPEEVVDIAYCSVVPDLDHVLSYCATQYFGIEPLYLRPGLKTGIKIKYSNPKEVGADRIALAIAAAELYPQKDIIIVNLSTATTFDALSADREYLGGAIAPGLQLSMQALEQQTAKLPKVEIIAPQKSCGRSTVESIQAGLYYGHRGMIRELCHSLSGECFPEKKPLILGSGDLAAIFHSSFDHHIPDLVLHGVKKLQEINR